MNAMSRSLMRHGVQIWIRTPKSSPLLLARHSVRWRHDDRSSFIFDQQPIKDSSNIVNFSDPFPNAPEMELDMPAAVEVLSEPTLSSLGLCSYNPIGLFQRGLELLHVSADLPWWGAIATGAVVLRLCLLPLVVSNRKATSKYVNAMIDIDIVNRKLTEAKMKGDMEEMYRVAKERERSFANVPFKSMFLFPFALGAVQIPMFWALRGMTNLPVESLKTGGWGWFLDLTAADPYFLLPTVSVLTYLIILETGMESSSGNPMNDRMKLVLRLIAPFIFIVTLRFPSAMTFYFCVNGLITFVQAFAFRSQRVQDALGIGGVRKVDRPIQIPPMPSKKTFQEGMQEALEISRMIQEMDERRRLQELAEKRSKEKKK